MYSFVKRKIFSCCASFLLLGGLGCKNLVLPQVLAITESEQVQFNKLSKATGISAEDIQNCLKFSVGEHSCELVIIDGSQEHLNCFMDIFAKEDDEEKNKKKSEYMKYYLNGKLRSKESVKNWFSRSTNRMNEALPGAITLMIKVDNKVVGRIGVGPLKGVPEIGYAIKQEYSGKGITKNAVNVTINFLRKLLDSKKYSFKKLRATAKEKNVASNKLLSGRGFKKSDKPIDDGYGSENEYFYHF